MATLGSIAKPALRGGGNPTDAIYQALASGSQAGLAGAGSLGTNSQLNNAFYQQGVANPYYQSHQVQLNRQGPQYQKGGMFYDPAIDGDGSGGSPGLGGGINPPPGGGVGPALGGGGANPGLGGGINPPPAGGVPSSAGGAVDWSKMDVSKFLDPNVGYRIEQGTNALQNTAAAKGGLLSGATLKGVSDYANNQAGQAYADAQNAAFHDRDFMRGQYTNDRDYNTALDQWNQQFGQRQFEFNTGADQFNRNFGQRQNEFNSNMGQRQHEFDTGADQWNRQFGEGNRRFDTGVDQSDRDFFYNANRDDRNFNYSSLMDLARMGQYGTSGNAGLMDSLARYLSANTIASGQAGAQGSLGSNNALMQMISQMLGMYQGNQFMSGLGGGG